MDRWTLYCHTHIESGRRYIGLTAQTMEKRWKNHVHASKSSKCGRWHFPNAIRKYGKNSFSHDVLEICVDLEVANLAEASWIEFYDTVNPAKGFNLAKGGSHSPHPVKKDHWNDPGFREAMSAAAKARWKDPTIRARNLVSIKATYLTPESKAKRSAISKAALSNPDVLKKLSESAKAHGISRETQVKGAAAWKGKTHDQETRSKISASSVRFWEPIKKKIRSASHKLCKVHGLISKSECYVYVKKNGGLQVFCIICRTEYKKSYDSRKN